MRDATRSWTRIGDPMLAKRTSRCARLSITIAFVVASAAAAGGCGGGKDVAAPPPAVRLSLTAPVDGARVDVSRLLVFGTVDPAAAAVRIDAVRVKLVHGSFRHWMPLAQGRDAHSRRRDGHRLSRN